jgi:shikimate kinase
VTAEEYPRSLALVGVKHSGKSAVGRAIAARTNRRFVDTDELVRDIYRAHSGRRLAVRDIYRIDDGETFRRLEAEACRAAAAHPAAVVATGGGLCDNAPALEALDGHCTVHLRALPERVAGRVFARGIPAFLREVEPAAARREFMQLMERRAARYEEVAHFAMDTDGMTPDECAVEIIRRIEEQEIGR